MVCVTGARKGLGQGLAIRFAQAGADLIVHVRRAGDEAETLAQLEPLGGRVAVAVADLEDEPAVSSALEAAASKLGGLDVVVNNAGAYPVEPIEDLAGDRFDAVTRANLGTAFRVTRWCAARWRLESRAGAIVNVSSVEATRPAFGHAHYASAKAALEMLTRVTAVELASGGIRVNAVAPGLIHYPELVELWPEGVARYRDRALLGREGDRMEVADACLFLASPAASWVTGTVLTVDGGVSAAPHF
ncbi:MAG: SDR family NAD(P)-dependent oxidoreductase [Myxococcota bacterium]